MEMQAGGGIAAGSIQSGTVKLWMEDSGTGFIAPIDGGADVFVERTALTDGQNLATGSLVTFEMGWDAAANRPVASMCVGALESGNTGSMSGMPMSAVGAVPDPTQQLWASQPAAAAAAALDNSPSDNLFICGLPATCTEDSLKQIFGAYGQVVNVKVLPDKGKPNRAALVRMSDSNVAQWLVENLNNNIPVGLATPISVRFAQKSASTTPTGTTMQGTVRIWLEERGMGFIVPSTGGEDFFVHRSNLCDGHSLVQGSTVSFDPAWDVQKEKPVAKKVSGAVPNPALVALGMGYGSGSKGAIAAQQAAAVGGASAAGQKTGFVKIWFEEKGYGFLTPDDGSGDAFIHRTAISEGSSLIQGSAVTYMAEWDVGKGRFIARECQVVTQNAAVPQIGKVKVWFEEKGYGFLTADDGSGDAFVHRSSLLEGKSLFPGAQVQYEAHWDSTKGKYIATKAVPIDSPTADQAAVAGYVVAASTATSDCVLVSGLPAACNEESLCGVFGLYGALQEIQILGEDGRGQSAWMKMGNSAQADWMCKNLNGNMPVGLETPIWVQLAPDSFGKAPAATVTPDLRVAPY